MNRIVPSMVHIEHATMNATSCVAVDLLGSLTNNRYRSTNHHSIHRSVTHIIVHSHIKCIWERKKERSWFKPVSYWQTLSLDFRKRLVENYLSDRTTTTTMTLFGSLLFYSLYVKKVILSIYYFFLEGKLTNYERFQTRHISNRIDADNQQQYIVANTNHSPPTMTMTMMMTLWCCWYSLLF